MVVNTWLERSLLVSRPLRSCSRASFLARISSRLVSSPFRSSSPLLCSSTRSISSSSHRFCSSIFCSQQGRTQKVARQREIQTNCGSSGVTHHSSLPHVTSFFSRELTAIFAPPVALPMRWLSRYCHSVSASGRQRSPRSLFSGSFAAAHSLSQVPTGEMKHGKRGTD